MMSYGTRPFPIHRGCPSLPVRTINTTLLPFRNFLIRSRNPNANHSTFCNHDHRCHNQQHAFSFLLPLLIPLYLTSLFRRDLTSWPRRRSQQPSSPLHPLSGCFPRSFSHISAAKPPPPPPPPTSSTYFLGCTATKIPQSKPEPHTHRRHHYYPSRSPPPPPPSSPTQRR